MDSTISKLLAPYTNRIISFYDYDIPENDKSLGVVLRHISIIRMSLTEDLKYTKLSEDESQMIYGLLHDSELVEDNHNESLAWKIHFLRIIWNRLYYYLGINIDQSKVNYLGKELCINSKGFNEGRYTYVKYSDRK